MVSKRRGFVSASIIAMVVLVLASPVSADTAYSEECWVEVEYINQNPPLPMNQTYDGQPWAPESNSSQDDVFWGSGDDVNISLELVLTNSHSGHSKTLDFKYRITVGSGSPPNQYKIIEGSSETENQAYENTVSVDYNDSDTRYIYVEVYEVDILDHVTVGIVVKIYDGMLYLADNSTGYTWVDSI